MDPDTALYASGDVAPLIEKHHEYVVRRLTALVGGNADDVAQAIYLELMETAADFDSSKWTFKQWLRRSIKRRGLEAYERTRAGVV